MAITITKSGILTTVQDLGRTGFRRFGINPSGPMDRAAFRIANIICGNLQNTPALELHFPAPELVFEKSSVFAVCGADFGPEVDGRPVGSWRPNFAPAGSKLSFSARRFGSRAYLAVSGGFAANRWLESAATNLRAKLGGFSGRSLMKDDRLEFAVDGRGDCPEFVVSPRLLPFYSPFPTIRVIPGPEFGLLDERSKELLFESDFEVTRRSDRMGYRLSGPELSLREPYEMVSSAVSFGTIQLLPDGQLIVLMADHQTAGGYPRIAQIIPTDLPLAAQIQATGKIALHEVSHDHAESLFLEFEHDLKILETACRFRFK